LQDSVWDTVYSSDLQRAATSLELILSKSKSWTAGRSYQKLEMLREISFGAREGLSRSISLEEAIVIKAKEEGIPVEQYIDTTEKNDAVKVRQIQFLKQLYHDHCNTVKDTNNNDHNNDCINVLCVSHGAYIKRFLKNFGDLSIEKIQNCAVSVLDIEFDSEKHFTCTPVAGKINVKGTIAHETQDAEAN